MTLRDELATVHCLYSIWTRGLSVEVVIGQVLLLTSDLARPSDLLEEAVCPVQEVRASNDRAVAGGVKS